ncbi:hypothetical protein GCM10020295_06900 [Streptomyces cinereospinus]
MQDVGCPFGQDARAAREAVVRLVRSMDEDPVPTPFSGTFSGQDLVGALGQALYSRDMWPSLERALALLVEDGDTRGVEAFATGGLAPGPPGERHRPAPPADGGLVDQEDVPLDNLPAALMAINCADDPDRPTARQITRDLGRCAPRTRRRRRSSAGSASPSSCCATAAPGGTDFIRERVKDVDTPRMLLVGTRGDPATPYRWTVQTAERLGPSAVVLDNKGDGHTGYASSKCVRGKVDAFLLYGSLPASGSSCGSGNGGGARP